MLKSAILRSHQPLVAILIASSVVFSGAQSAPPQSSQNASQPATAAAKPAGATQSAKPAGTAQSAKPAGASAHSSASAAKPATPWRGSQAYSFSRRADMYYQEMWGVSELHVKSAESGELIRFDYRVLDPQKAAYLNDKKVEPQLIDSQAGVRLAVPQMQNVGKLRQSSSPKAGMVYWMAFANPTLAVKRGHRVDVVIGSFHANSLVVE